MPVQPFTYLLVPFFLSSRNRTRRLERGDLGRVALFGCVAAFVCAALSIQPTVRHADYLGNWLSVLRSDNRAIFRAASKASKAADFLLAFRAPVTASTDDQARDGLPA